VIQAAAGDADDACPAAAPIASPPPRHSAAERIVQRLLDTQDDEDPEPTAAVAPAIGQCHPADVNPAATAALGQQTGAEHGLHRGIVHAGGPRWESGGCAEILTVHSFSGAPERTSPRGTRIAHAIPAEATAFHPLRRWTRLVSAALPSFSSSPPRTRTPVERIPQRRLRMALEDEVEVDVLGTWIQEASRRRPSA